MQAIPNYLSFCRMFLSPILFFVKPLGFFFYAIYFACGVSDVLDGLIARRTGTTSKLGAKLDTIADMIMVGVLFIILYPLVNPTIDIIIWVITISIIRLTSIVVALLKFKDFAILHTCGNKITGVFLFLFPFLLFYIQTSTLMYIVCIVASLSAIEELAVHLTSRELQVNKQSIFVK